LDIVNCFNLSDHLTNFAGRLNLILGIT